VSRRRTVLDFAKGRGPYVWITAYDYPTARLADEAGVDGILVGDSLGMVVLGLPNTLGVSMADMVRHTEAVARAKPKAFVVADMPFMSYEPGPEAALRNASRLIRAGADAVKLEGGAEYAHVVERLVKAGIQVMDHIGLTPQRVLTLGGFRMVGRTEEQRRKILEDAKALRDAGVFAMVLEFVPASLAKEATEAVDVPTICIGSGPHCDGQIIVLHDVIGLSERPPSFAKRYADAAALIKDAVAKYAEEVRKGLFPSREHYRE
jgi:3-methyl-2-oxobutanoate hydroxymethyltransferase